MTRKALGRGLGALLSADVAAPKERSDLIAIERISANPAQPRSHFDAQRLQELADSIKENGVVQPLVVRRSGSGYQLVAGERRLRAAELAGLSEVPAVVRDIPDDKLLEIALIENIQREELNPIEEALAYRNLIQQVGLTQEVLAKRVGRDRSYITNYLRLLRLPDELQQLVQEGKLSTGHARALLAVEDPQAQSALARRVIAQGLSVRTTETLVRQSAEGKVAGKSRAAAETKSDPNIEAAETKLRRKFGTKVRIRQDAVTLHGTIELRFNDDAELIRIFDLLVGESAAGAGK